MSLFTCTLKSSVNQKAAACPGALKIQEQHTPEDRVPKWFLPPATPKLTYGLRLIQGNILL